jgi:prepilin-type processing-associated H-X9-DG protein
MLEINHKDLIGSYVTDIEYHAEGTGELLTIWVRLVDKRLVSITPCNFTSNLISCPWSEEFHGGSLNVLFGDDPLINACITDIDVTSDRLLTTFGCNLPINGL